MSSLTLAQARAVAVRAQRLDRRRATAPLSLLRHLGAVQIDSVNVVARAHYLPFFARLEGRRGDVDRLVSSPRTTEYWAHEASLLTVEDRALFAWRMRSWDKHAWGNALQAAREHPGLREMILTEVAAEPATARALELRLEAHHPRERTDWGWNWSLVKRVSEALFWAGELSTSGRNPQFERIYTLGGVPGVDDDWAAEELVARTLRACGVADRRTIRDYFRLSPAITDRGIDRALASGRITRVTVDGAPWYADAALVVPRRAAGTALLAPFDPLLWDRRRVERIFGFRYRIEIYTPAPRREYGYYVLPFLFEGGLVARVDLKADRKARRLLVRGAFSEPDMPPGAVDALRRELGRLSHWLELDDVQFGSRGPLAARLGGPATARTP